jgi:hypothetical protein
VKRNYVILKRFANGDIWDQVTAQYASSRRAAVRNVEHQLGPGTYLVLTVPEMSKRTIEVEKEG